MKVKISILYSWLVRTITYFLPNIPIFMRFRGWLYSLMMKECGENFQITSSAIINTLSELKIGKNVYIASNTVIVGLYFQIEDNVLIGPNCVISGRNHSFFEDSFRYGPPLDSLVIIGRGSWVSGNCTITAGSILPPRSILAAGAVLNKAFDEEQSLYGGVPAKFLKKILV